MITNGDTITVAEWADESALSRSARSTRKLVLSLYAKANGKITAEEMVADILTDKVTPYVTAREATDRIKGASF